MITPNIIERSWIQGATVAVEYLTGTAFSGENGAHTFRITGKDAEGQPVAVSGTVLAKILRADNITVDVSGSVVDGVAEVTLVGDCYNVPGRTSLVIFLSDGTNTVTLYAAIFNVFRSTSGEEIDSGVSIPTLTELLAQIERMEAATAAAEAATNRAEHLLETSETTAWNQIVPNGNFASTSGWQKYSGHSFAVANNELTLTVNSTSTRSRIYREDLVITGDHKYYVHGELKASQNAQPLYIRLGGVDITKSGYEADTWYLLDGVITAVGDGSTVTLAYGADQSHRLSTGESFSARNVWAVDLTAIYGEGNEPTAEEVRQLYPHRYYDYAAIGSTRYLDITEVHGAQIAELQDDLSDANDAITANATAITALDNAKADKADLAHTNRVLSALVEAGKGKILRFETDDDDAYAKSVPSGALNATVTEIGGHSEAVGGEIVNADVVSIVTSGANIVPSNSVARKYVNSSGEIMDTTVKTYAGYNGAPFDVVAGETIAISNDMGVSVNPTVATWDKDGALLGRVLATNGIYTFSANEATAYIYYHPQTDIDDSKVANGHIWALRSNEQGEYIPYITPVTHPIPSAVLSAYPLRSAGSVYDTISFDGSKWWHRKAVGTVDLGTLTNYAYNGSYNAFNSTMPTDAKVYNASQDAYDGVCATYAMVAENKQNANMTIAPRNNNTANIFIKNTDYGAEQQDLLKESLSGMILFYALATPILTDITDLMGDAGTDLIAMAVESGGTITFAQQNGTIFPVPNSVTYTVKISEVE